jgi:hypothetical protein
MITLQSCTVNDNTQPTPVVNNVPNEVFEVTRSFTASNGYGSLISFPHTILSSDVVLVYRLDNVVNGTDIWKPLPQTFFFNDGTLDFRYDFDFSQYDVDIYMDGNDLGTISTNYRINQVFRIVLIPADFIGKKNLKTMDYNSVVKMLNIQSTDIVKVQ